MRLILNIAIILAIATCILCADDFYIGNPTSTIWQNVTPFNLPYWQSLNQTIYYQEELLPGLITSIGYNFSRGGSVAGSGGYPDSEKAIKIWMKSTDKAVFTSITDFSPYVDFILVFDGTIPINIEGINDITIELDTPFSYVGGNLIVMTQRMHEEVSYSQLNTWHSTATAGQYRSISFYENATPIADISEGFPFFTNLNTTRHSLIPNTTLCINTGPFATLEGHITDISTGEPLPDVQISIDGITHVVFTDAEGNYYFPYIDSDDIRVTAIKHGYITIHTEITTLPEQTYTLDMQMTSIPTVTINGIVLALDTLLSVAEATVSLEGYADYGTITLEDGSFTFYEVFANEIYTLRVIAQHFQGYIDENIVVESSPLTLPDILLNEILYPPLDVRTYIGGGNTLYQYVAWLPPDPELTRSLTGYNIYRSIPEEVDYENLWLTLGTNRPRGYYDYTWNNLPLGNYIYIVKAVYTGDLLSEPAFSDIVNKGVRVTVNITTSDGESAERAVVRLTNTENPIFDYEDDVAINDRVMFPNVCPGIYTVTTSKWNYDTSVTTEEVLDTPTTLSAHLVRLTSIYQEMFSDRNELPADWTIISDPTSEPWRVAWLISVLYNGDPILYYSLYGLGAGMVISSATPTVDNWLISPSIQISSNTDIVKLHYFICTFFEAPQNYGVYVSTTDTNIESFSPLLIETSPSGWEPIQEWVLRTVNLEQYIGQSIYIAFRHFDSTGNKWLLLNNVNVVSHETLADLDEVTITPSQTSLQSNYPNPFNPSTTIAFDIANDGHVLVEVYNVRGQKVKTLIDGMRSAGSHKVIWDGIDTHGREVSSGVYFYRMVANGSNSVRKMLLVK